MAHFAKGSYAIGCWSLRQPAGPTGTGGAVFAGRLLEQQQPEQPARRRPQQEQSEQQEQQHRVSGCSVGPRFAGPATLPEMRRDHGCAAEAGPPATLVLARLRAAKWRGCVLSALRLSEAGRKQFKGMTWTCSRHARSVSVTIEADSQDKEASYGSRNCARGASGR